MKKQLNQVIKLQIHNYHSKMKFIQLNSFHYSLVNKINAYKSLNIYMLSLNSTSLKILNLILMLTFKNYNDIFIKREFLFLYMILIKLGFKFNSFYFLNKKFFFNVLRSPFVNNKSGEQFELNTKLLKVKFNSIQNVLIYGGLNIILKHKYIYNLFKLKHRLI